GTFRGFYWSGSQWVEDSSIVAGLSSSVYATPALAFNVRQDNRWILISRSGSMLLGFYWSGSQWVEDSSIVSGISGSFHHAVTLGFNATGNNRWILISGKVWGEFHGFYWNVNLPPNPPQLDTPPKNERFDPATSVTFTWTFNDPDADDSQSAYRFQLDDNSDFSSPIIDTGKVSSSENSVAQALPSMVGLYYWRVKTWDSQDAESDWSEVRSIIVDCFNIKTIKVQDDRVDAGASINVWFEVCRAYDDAVFNSGSGVVYVNGSEAAWDPVVGAWKATVSMDTIGEARFAISNIIDNEYGITTINAMLHFDGIDDYVQTSTIPNPFSAEQTIIAWVRGEPEDTVYSKLYYGKDYPGEVGENWYDPSVGREVRRVLVGTSAGYLCDGISVPAGFNGPFALTTYSKVTDNTQSLLAWKVEVWENGVLKYSYSAYANQLRTTYVWRESPTWWFNGSKSYEIKVYWPGNVDLYLERVSILARRGGIGYGSVYPSSMLFQKPEQDKIQIGYYTRKSDGSYSWIWFSSATIPVDSNFHQVAVTLGDGVKSLYIDGLLRQQVAGQGDLYPADTYFKISGIWRYFYGIIDEVYIYNRSLSSEEIKQVYLGEKITEGLILYFSGHMANEIIYDDSGSSNHGTLYGPTLDFMSRQSPAIIWDRIKIISGGVVDFTIDVDVGGKIWYYAVYEYDNSTFDSSCGVLYVNGFEMTWDGEKWLYAFPYSTEGNQITFHITGVLDNQYGLTEVNNQVGDITLNWATMTIEIKKG
ncbi:MAG: LamG-like jellyroll fold domain-containing protein, partial [Candidatus Heimdallarchaeota archaeon]